MKRSSAVALGGMLAAVAMVIMCLGGLIPVATYVCPMLCVVLQFLVLRLCGRRIAWAWFCAVSLLSLLLGPDKEAAAVFVFLGYYPMLKPRLDSMRLRWLWKLLLFNGVVVLLYTVLLRFMGLESVSAEFQEFGNLALVVMLVMGNTTFFLLDRLLDMMGKKQWKHR